MCNCTRYLTKTNICTGKENNTKPAKKDRAKPKKKPGTVITISDHVSSEELSSDPTPSSRDQPTSVPSKHLTLSDKNQQATHKDQPSPSLKDRPTPSEIKSSVTVPADLNVSFSSSTPEESIEIPFSHPISPDYNWYENRSLSSKGSTSMDISCSSGGSKVSESGKTGMHMYIV